jgi:hypothetical protein
MEATAPASTESSALEIVRARIAERFGLVPSFFMMARAEPPIVEAMFGLVEFAYFDSPLPALFKERLFTYVSRFCRVPYCMARHCAFLLGCGNVAGDPEAQGISVDQAVALLRTPFPNAERRDELLKKLRAAESELDQWPRQESDLGETIFFAAAVVFVMPREHTPLVAQLERVLGTRRFNYLMLFLGFIRFAHFWTESHQELRLEDDIESLLDEQRTLAEWVAAYPEEVDSELARAKAELRELELLRERTERSETTVAELPGVESLATSSPGQEGAVFGSNDQATQVPVAASVTPEKRISFADAVTCLDRAFTEPTGQQAPEGQLVRVIQARYRGVPAVLGVYLLSPGAGQPADIVRVLVASSRDCSILTSTQATT